MEKKIIGFNEKENKITTLKAMMADLLKTDAKFEVYSDIGNFAQKLREMFFDYEKYQLYHLLASSTTVEGEISKFDFPGEYSVENFINQLNEKYGKYKER